MHSARPTRPDARAAGSPTDPTDRWRDLMSAAQDGDDAAYRRLLGEIEPWLRRRLVRRMPAESVDDAVQETLLAVHLARHAFDRGRPFRPWLVSIAHRKRVDQLRLLARDLSEPLADERPVPDHGSAVVSATVLERLLRRLAPAQALVIRMTKLTGLSVDEASRASGQSVSLVKVNVHRGLARLAAMLRAEAASDQPARAAGRKRIATPFMQ